MKPVIALVILREHAELAGSVLSPSSAVALWTAWSLGDVAASDDSGSSYFHNT